MFYANFKFSPICVCGRHRFVSTCYSKKEANISIERNPTYMYLRLNKFLIYFLLLLSGPMCLCVECLCVFGLVWYMCMVWFGMFIYVWFGLIYVLGHLSLCACVCFEPVPFLSYEGV